MSPAAAFAALGVLLGAAAAWELAAGLDGRLRVGASGALRVLSGGVATSLAELASRLGVAQRLRQAGLERSLGVPALMAGKVLCACAGALCAAVVAPVAPGRFAIVVAAGLPIAGFLGPDVWLERAGRRRRRRLVAALPDALDLLAVGAAIGRGPAVLLDEIAAVDDGPLAVELARTVAELECGVPQHAALRSLRARAPGAELGAFAGALARSSRHGSPLADQLQDQATSLRRAQRRRLGEQAARSAPKIQLVVALILVPSVLAMIAAALLAHLDTLLVGF